VERGAGRPWWRVGLLPNRSGRSPTLQLLVAGWCWCGGAILSAQDVDVAPAAAGGYPHTPALLESGRTIFQQQCLPCHTLAAEGFGPPLGGVTTVLPEARLVDWVRDPAKIIASGDVRANALLRRYKLAMPSFAHLAPEQVHAVLAYLDAESAARGLRPFTVDLTAPRTTPRLVPPVQTTGLTIELEDYVKMPLLPGRTAYQGITLLRPDPREAGALFVDDLMGVLYRVQDRQPAVFLDLRGLFPDFFPQPGVASGFGSFALHPDFVHNGIFYTTHSESRRGRPVINAGDIPADVPPYETPPIEWVLTEWRLADPGATVFAGTHREVLRFVTPTTGHGAQEIAFAPVSEPHDPDYAKLYLGVGDGGSINLKRHDMAGHPRTLLGSILRIDPAGHDGASGQYGIPPDNPFATSTDPGVHREIWAYGFRNPHRLTWDSAHGRQLIAVDIGESNLEEVNLVRRGGAYGWGVGHLEGIAHIDATVDPKVVHPATAEQLAPYIAPFALYEHDDGTAVTGGYVYHGPLEALRDKYVFGDIVNGRVFYLDVHAGFTDHTVYEISVARGGEPTTVKQLGHLDRAHLRLGYDERTGDLFLLTKGDGMIRRVVKAYLKGER